jgi:HD-GYP domain-containing protein (c-di-GMP phosphodiesterase class II)
VIDAYDVMTHDRPYKQAISHEQALEELRKYSGTQFDPEIVNGFIKMMMKLE